MPNYMKNHMKLNILTAAILSFTSSQQLFAIQYKEYNSDLNAGGCTLVNIKSVDTGGYVDYPGEIGSNGKPDASTITPDNKRLGNGDGTFNVVARDGQTCNLSSFFNKGIQTSNTTNTGSGPITPLNPYYQQRNNAADANFGQIYYLNLNLGTGTYDPNDPGQIYGSVVTAAGKLDFSVFSLNNAELYNNAEKLTELTAPNYIVFETDRASRSAINVGAGTKFETSEFDDPSDPSKKIKQSLFLRQTTTNAHGLSIGGTVDIKGNLDIYRTHGTKGLEQFVRLLYMQGGTLIVGEDLRTRHETADINATVNRSSGPSWDVQAGSTLTVKGNAILENATSAAGIRTAGQSTLDFKGNLTVTQEQPNITDEHKKFTSNAIQNAEKSVINVAGQLSIKGDEHVLISQNGNAIFNIHGETTLEKKTKGDYIQNDNSTIYFEHEDIKFIAGTINTGLKSNGLVNTNNAHVYFNAANTVIEADNLDNALVNSNNATINFRGDISTVKGTVENSKNGIINIEGESIFEKTSGSNLIKNDNAVINFNHNKITFNGESDSDGLVNTNNAHVYFNAEDTLLEASVLDNAIVNSNGATVHFVADKSSVNGNINNINRGIITLQNEKNGSELTINGNYVGADGILMMDVDLDDDNSDKDFVIINGTASGTTELQLNNINGLGSPTRHGIHIIQTNDSEKGAFYIANKGYVSAGAHDYYLEYRQNDTAGDNAGSFDNWYLMNYDYKDYIYTPDIGSYLAVETMGNTLFNSRLEDREGASQFQNLHDRDKGNVWVRAYGGHNQFKSMDGQLKTKGNSFVTQFGTGLVSLGEEDQYNLGVMGGLAYYNGKTRSSLTTRESKAEINGYSLGLYGTWYSHPVEEQGAYVDSWVLWNQFRNHIDTPDQHKYKYSSTGVTASIEVGGDYLLNKNGKKDWWIQPQTQLIYQGVHADNFKDAQDIDINHGKDNIQARIGVKTYLNIPTNGNKLTSYRPYVALNFIHNTNPYSVIINDVAYMNEGAANLGEFKVGLEGHTTKNSQVWINASYVAGSHDNQAYQGNIGWKYNF